MKISINFPQLAFEFLIVFIGVVVALAADNWREEKSNKRLEANYLLRIENDLVLGQAQLENTFSNAKSAEEGTSTLITYLEGDLPLGSNEILNSFVLASRVGYSSGTLLHDLTYRELLSTGRLDLISKPEILAGISAYYRFIEDIESIRSSLLTFTTRTFSRHTGNVSYRVTASDLSSRQKESLLGEIDSNPEMLYELRRLKSQLLTLIGLMPDGLSRFDRARQTNTELLQL